MTTTDILRTAAADIAPQLALSDQVLERAEELLGDTIRRQAPKAIKKAIIDSLEMKRPAKRITRRRGTGNADTAQEVSGE